MIKKGTLCILLAPHHHAGKTCTVTSNLEERLVTHYIHLYCYTSTCYIIDIFENGMYWVAKPKELRPLNDPDSAKDFKIDVRKPELLSR